MDYTGERFIPGKAFGEIETEHLHRYSSLSDIVRGKIVLDAACGEGYGTYIMSGSAKYVYGVDISEESIEYAITRYKKDNIEYKQCSIGKLAFKDNSIDVVVSFETIEHIDADIQEDFLREIKRVLKKDGLLIISTPDKYVYSDLPNYKNKYHVKEFYHDEFKIFLSNYFENVFLYYQSIESLGILVSQNATEDSSFKLKGIGDSYRGDGRYIIALCSDKRINNTNSISSIFPEKREKRHFDDIIQVFWDMGNGYNEEKSEKINYKYSEAFTKYRIQLPQGKLASIRLDIGNTLSYIQLRNIIISHEYSKGNIEEHELLIKETRNMLPAENDSEYMVFASISDDPQIIFSYINTNDNYENAYLEFEMRTFPSTSSEYIQIVKRHIEDRELKLINADVNAKMYKGEIYKRDEEIRKNEEQIRAQEEAYKKLAEEVYKRDEEVYKRDEEIKKNEEQVRVQEEAYKKLTEEVYKRDDEIKKNEEQIRVQEETYKKLTEEIYKRDEEIKKSEEQIMAMEEANRRQAEELNIQAVVLNDILNSKSWMCTKPFRLCGTYARKLIEHIKVNKMENK